MPNSAAPLDVPFWAWLLFAGVILLSLIIDLIAHRGGRGHHFLVVEAGRRVATFSYSQGPRC